MHRDHARIKRLNPNTFRILDNDGREECCRRPVDHDHGGAKTEACENMWTTENLISDGEGTTNRKCTHHVTLDGPFAG